MVIFRIERIVIDVDASGGPKIVRLKVSRPKSSVPTQFESDGPSRHRRTTLAGAVENIEREMIQSALERSAGNISETARILGLTRRGLYLKMDRLGVNA